MTQPPANENSGLIRSGFRRHVLIPLGMSLLVLAAMTVTGFHWYAEKQIDRQVRSKVAGVDRLFHLELERDAYLFGNLIDSLKQNSCIESAFSARDRARLLQCTEQLYKDQRARYRITHFYFHLPDRTNFLRVHHPQRHGDRIERFTLDKALETDSNVQGIELGTFGTFTLRVVHPWRIDDELVGYIELGEEIEHFTERLKQILGVDLLFVIYKEFTTRSDWEEGQRMLGNHEDWDEYPDFVIIDRTSHIWMPELQGFLEQSHRPDRHDNSFHVRVEGRDFRVSGRPLTDADGRPVGHILVIVDTSEAQTTLKRVVSYLSAITLLAIGLLAGFFWFYFGRFQATLVEAQTHWLQTADEQQMEETRLLDRQQALILERQQYQRLTVEEQTLGLLLRLALQPTPMGEYLYGSLEQLVSSIPWLAHLPEGAVFLAREQDGNETLELAASHNFAPQLQIHCSHVPLGTCLCGRAAANREAVFSSEVDESHEIRFDGMVPHGHYAIPLLREQQLLGVFTLYLPHGAVHSEKDEVFLKRVAEVFSLGIENRRNGSMAAMSKSDRIA